MKKNIFAAATLCTLLLLGAQPANTKEKEAAVITAIQEKYSSVNNLSFPFAQETQLKDLEEKITSSGKVWFKKPAMMKWQYEEPWKDTVVSDGKKLRYYDSRENQVTEVEIGSVWGDSFGSYIIISILEDLESVFEVRSGKRNTDREG
ncbi:MAG: outer membrane lipoprotein carrier protein LolA, partial [Candidatus Dadabacteria bacterium]|nr:outer membrane lipoprotein carrier protein LolA [Candidatus Dadabacteria bacterium]